MGYQIGEVAKRLGISTSTLRYYEAEGLLPAVERTPGGSVNSRSGTWRHAA